MSVFSFFLRLVVRMRENHPNTTEGINVCARDIQAYGEKLGIGTGVLHICSYQAELASMGMTKHLDT